jgi:hypothetical protein
MRKLWTVFLVTAALVLLVSSAVMGASFTPKEDNVPPLSKDAFLKQLAGSSPEVSLQTTDVICCDQNCCELISQASCQAAGGHVYSTAVGCNKACLSCR